ncbi:metallophosphoesterase [Olleya sp. R77988]|uniref:metallophosphoesterase n=1 Tax=Olleya sp. R77988 TaxID=3093875 RepID=UPI0037C8B93B
MRIKQLAIIIIIANLLNACATFKPQYKDENNIKTFPKDKILEHSFYLIGDAGNSPIGSKSDALKAFEKALSNAPSNSTALFLGDNIYPNGLVSKDHKDREFAQHQLKTQTQAVKDFKGNTIFIPGNHDWYSGLKGLKRQEKFVEDALGKNTFLPENGCPIQKVTISDDVVMIIVDSHWYVTNWDKHPTINDNCDIKTRT